MYVQMFMDDRNDDADDGAEWVTIIGYMGGDVAGIAYTHKEQRGRCANRV